MTIHSMPYSDRGRFEYDRIFNKMVFKAEHLKDLKVAYERCDGEVFVFKGCEFLKSYAKYLIEYLESKFKD